MLFALTYIFSILPIDRCIFSLSTGREEISKAIGSKTDLVDLCHRLNVKSSGVLQIMSKFVTFPPHMIGRCTLKMLNEWVHQGGTRERLLEVAQAFRFNDAAVKIAEGSANDRFTMFTYYRLNITETHIHKIGRCMCTFNLY